MSKNSREKKEFKGDPSGYIKNLRFRKKTIGGLDEADVWRKINGLNEQYEEAYRQKEQLLTAGKKAQTDEQSTAEEIRKQRRKILDKKEIISFFVRLAVFIAFLYLLFGILFGIAIMPDESMKPRFSAGDVMLFYRLDKNPGSSDIIVFEKDGVEYVGRVIAKPGDSVEIPPEGGLRINGSIVIENDIYYETRPYDNDVSYPIALADEEVFVLCDYRDGGKDSRYFGAVRMSEIKGKVLAVLRRSGL
ncbi:MAG: signal peptidase I [Lachnospiraceae bacterium]|nr:signal peptidase I [Lachnospiraceae bacterium]